MTNTVQHLLVTENEASQRLDNYLIRILKGVPKTYIYRIIRQGQVRVNKKRAMASTRLCTGDVVRVPPVRATQALEPKHNPVLNEYLNHAIIYEDEGFLVLNKPAGLAVHGGSGLSFGVIECLRQSRGDLHYLELVHRLDKETSGCLLLAKKRSVLRALQALFVSKSIQKKYWALLHGKWEGTKKQYVDVPLLKNVNAAGERIVTVHEEGKASKTRFILLANTEHYCLVEASPQTGRTHQIRVHSTYLGHPIVGDSKYHIKSLKPDAMLPSRLYLHAHSIQFTLNGKSFEFTAKPDERFLTALTLLDMQVDV